MRDQPIVFDAVHIKPDCMSEIKSL